MKSRNILKSLFIVFVILSLILNFSVFVKAENETVGLSNIVNGGFEYPDLKSLDTGNKGWLNTTKDEVPGWETTSTDNKIEFGWIASNNTSPHMIEKTVTEIIGEGASNGVQFGEVVGNEASSLYQSIYVSSDSSYNWTLHHRGRDGIDTLALFITDDSNINYVKSNKRDTDHFYQILNWLKEEGITAPEVGNMSEYIVYTTKLLEPCSFEESSTGSYFSFTPDEEHNVKFEIHLMSTDKKNWGEYTGSYFSDKDKNILFVITPFNSASTKNPESCGNLVDNFSFLDNEGNNLFINSGFDDIEINAAYKYLKAANASNPVDGVGWCTTATDYNIEVGNLLKGNPYNILATFVTTILNPAWVREGNQFAELNAEQESSLYQIVRTDSGKMYKWSLSHRGRDGLDTMALIIGPNQDYAPKKATSNSRDQLMQIVDWLYSQTERALDIPDKGCSNMITLYSSKFANNGQYVLSSNPFSWVKDENHTEKWSVWIISSANDTWHDYGELDESATYDYKYIVPMGQSNSIFGFVSINSTRENGMKNPTYGNLLDNISFKEYYYININNAANNAGGNVYITNDDGTFIFETPNSGWALVGSNIQIHVKEGEREFIGGFVDDNFLLKDNWVYDEELGEYIYSIENVESSKSLDVKYVAKTVVYDSCNDYEYQYDGEGSGFEVPMGASLSEYISHEPNRDEGWKFLGWEYVSPKDSTVYLLNGVHKVVFNENRENELLSTFSIYNILENGNEDLVVDDISFDMGITFKAKYKYRQLIIAKTFNNTTSSYINSTDGGNVEVSILSGENVDISDYIVDSEVLGKEVYSSADNTYIQISAHNKIGFGFNGWYDADGNLVSTSTSYTYKVQEGVVNEYYAYFEPVGYNLVIDNTVTGNFGDTTKYFAVNLHFSNLRENKVYMITGLTTDIITLDNMKITNPNKIKADSSGEANVTVYMKHNDLATFIYLPENCIYSVDVLDYSNEGYTIIGEVYSQVLVEESNINLIYNSEISPPMGVYIETKYWNYMLNLGLLLFIIMEVYKAFKRNEGDIDE